MKFLLDTDTCLFWLRGRVSVRDRLAAVVANNLEHFRRIPGLHLENWVQPQPSP